MWVFIIYTLHSSKNLVYGINNHTEVVTLNLERKPLCVRPSLMIITILLDIFKVSLARNANTYLK